MIASVPAGRYLLLDDLSEKAVETKSINAPSQRKHATMGVKMDFPFLQIAKYILKGVRMHRQSLTESRRRGLDMGDSYRLGE